MIRGSEIDETCSNTGLFLYVHLGIITLGQGMKPSPVGPTSYGLNSRTDEAF